MKKLMIVLLTITAMYANGQCDPDQAFYPAASLEAHTEGFRGMAGVVGQTVPLNAFVGATTQARIVEDKNGVETVEFKIRPVYELHLRLPISTRTTSFHLYGNNYGGGAGCHASIGEWTAVKLRAGYESQFIAGIGLLVLFN